MNHLVHGTGVYFLQAQVYNPGPFSAGYSGLNQPSLMGLSLPQQLLRHWHLHYLRL